MTGSDGGRYRLNTAALHQALDVVRCHRRLDWRDVAAETGVSAATLTRLRQGHSPSADGLCGLLVWLGHADTLRPYIAAGRELDGPVDG